MSPRDYKAACERPDVFRRSVLVETLRVVQAELPELALRLEAILNQPPLEKPHLHTGEKWNDFICVSISVSDAEMARGLFVDRESGTVSLGGNATALTGHYAEIADAWTNYIFGLDGTI